MAGKRELIVPHKGDRRYVRRDESRPDRPGRRTVARAHLEDDGRVLLHRHFFIDDIPARNG